MAPPAKPSIVKKTFKSTRNTTPATEFRAPESSEQGPVKKILIAASFTCAATVDFPVPNSHRRL